MAFFPAAVQPMSGSAVRKRSDPPGAARQPRPGRGSLLPPGPGGRQQRRHQHLRFDVSPNEHDSASRNERATRSRYGTSAFQMQIVLIRICGNIWNFAQADSFER